MLIHFRRIAALAILSCSFFPLGGVSASPAPAGLQLIVQPGAHLTPVLSLIHEARSTIRLEVYLLTDRTVISALGAARRRGVDVRVMLEEHPFGSGRYAQLGYAALQQAGVPVRWANEGAFTYTHEKAMEVDNSFAGIFTFNLTSSGFFRNREFGIVERNSADARALAALFGADWNRRHASFSDPRLVVSPLNARHDIQLMLDRARHTLDLYEEEVNDTSIESHLSAAVRRHVRVRLITSGDGPQLAVMRRSGVEVLIMPHPYVHAKAIVADGTTVFIGSENISATSLDRNREAGIMLHDVGLAARVESVFSGDWSGHDRTTTPPPPPAQPRALRVQTSATPTSVLRGQVLTITAQTLPDAVCTVRVTYPDGYVSRAAALSQRQTVGSSGAVSWSWRVGSSSKGAAHATVTCSLSGDTATATAVFQID